MTGFNGKIALISGAGKGIGRKLALAFAKQGAIVAANDITPNNVNVVVDEINAGGGQARAYIDDVTKKVAVQAIIKQIVDNYDRLDILVNHASVRPRSPLLDMDEWDWRRTLDVNLTAAFLMTQVAGRIMREQCFGVIINIIPEENRAIDHRQAAFHASRAGLVSFSQDSARELAPEGIRVYEVGAGTKVEKVFDLCRKSF